jgi:hypothetical protein
VWRLKVNPHAFNLRHQRLGGSERWFWRDWEHKNLSSFREFNPNVEHVVSHFTVCYADANFNVDIANLKVSTPCAYLSYHMYYHQLVHSIEVQCNKLIKLPTYCGVRPQQPQWRQTEHSKMHLKIQKPNWFGVRYKTCCLNATWHLMLKVYKNCWWVVNYSAMKVLRNMV